MGPNFLKSWFYQLSPVEVNTVSLCILLLDISFVSERLLGLFLKNLELAKTLVRPGSLFQQDLSKAKKLSDEGYETVTRVFVVCDKDQAMNNSSAGWFTTIPLKLCWRSKVLTICQCSPKPDNFVTFSWRLPTNMLNTLHSISYKQVMALLINEYNPLRANDNVLIISRHVMEPFH